MIERLQGLPVRELGGSLRLVEAATRRSRALGLARLDELPPGVALLIPRCRSVHTVSMRFTLDLLWLDAAGSVVRVDRGVGPRRVRTCLRARSVLECRAGEAERFASALGQ